VGDPVLHSLGISIGTLIGTTYANLFPGKVGHMVLDGDLNPVTFTSGDHTLPVFLRQGTDEASAATPFTLILTDLAVAMLDAPSSCLVTGAGGPEPKPCRPTGQSPFRPGHGAAASADTPPEISAGATVSRFRSE
jgi:pimeloyl-ACP methyl ester carboxylesterase